MQPGDRKDPQHPRLRVADHQPDAALPGPTMRRDEHTEPGDVEADHSRRVDGEVAIV